MNPEQREIIRSSLHQIDLILRAIWRTAREQIKQAELVQKRINDIEELKKPLYEVLDREAKVEVEPCYVCHEKNGYHKPYCARSG